MDTNQFITLVVAAVVGTLARELVSWLIKRSKSVDSQTKTLLQSFFNKKIITLIVDLIVFYFTFRAISNLYQRTEPITRVEVYAVVICFELLAFFFYKAANDLEAWAHEAGVRLKKNNLSE